MQLLDATLAFALTLAALATLVTVLMETAHRALKIRKRNLFELMQHLNEELDWLPEPERWEFVVRCLNNPMGTPPGTAEAQRRRMPAWLPGSAAPGAASGAGAPPRWLVWIVDRLTGRRACLPEQMPAGTCSQALRALGILDRGRGVHDEVSLEHVLRRLAELPSSRDLATGDRPRMEAELDRVARCYQTVKSGVSADFRRSAQMWSLVLGVVFALAANVDGLRIFAAFKSDQALRERVIEKHAEMEKASVAALGKLEETTRALEERDAALGQVVALNRAGAAPETLARARENVAAKQATFAAAENAAAETLRAAGTDTAGLIDLGVPIGTDYWPLGERERPEGRQGPPTASDYLVWVFRAGLTGLLIGLGAPFWFDVARRLAQVRQAFGGEASAENRLKGSEAPDNDARRSLVREVVDDALADTRAAELLRAPDETIVRVQRLLERLGHLEPAARARESGVLSHATLSAISAFFRAQGIRDDEREAVFGDVSGPDFLIMLLGELEDAVREAGSPS